VPPERIVEFAVATLGGLDIEFAFVSCTNFRAMEAVPGLSARLGLPVVTSNQAVLAATIERVLGLFAL